jgi:hypothetical protein
MTVPSGHNIYLVDLPLLLVLISLVYSATRSDNWSAIVVEAVRWGLRLIIFLGAIAVALFFVDRL